MLDCLIVHVPKFQNRYTPLGDYTSLQWMASGIFALADALARAGFTARILHLGIEKNLDSRFTLGGYLAAHPSRVVAFSLQFHQQLYDTLRAAKAVKEADPSCHVVLGGMTASFFAKEILAGHPQVDTVIRGEGELPLARLVDAVTKGRKDLSAVPNLAWRKDGAAVLNEISYVASQEDLDRLDFCTLSYMEHHERYPAMPKIFTRLALPGRLRWKVSRLLSAEKRPLFYGLPVGRGCVTDCFYCGGGRSAHRLLGGRNRPVFRSREKVIRSIRQLIGYGYAGTYASFDPLPESDAYYRALFEALRAEGIDFYFIFSAWALPSHGFIEAFGKGAAKGSRINISPETGSERLRREARGIYYSNAQLLDALRFAEERGVKTLIDFSLGIPGETREDFAETLRLRDAIVREFSCARVEAFAVEIEPAAPWHLSPEKYGITLCRSGLDDFLREQAAPGYSTMSSTGCYPREYLGEPVTGLEEYARRVLDTKCRFFCSRVAMCRAAGMVWGAARFLRLSRSGDVPL